MNIIPKPYNVTPVVAARNNERKTSYKRLSLNKYDKLDSDLKAARNEIERIKRIVARHSDPGDATVEKLERFWYQFEAIRGDLIGRCEHDDSMGMCVKHYARKLPSEAQ